MDDSIDISGYIDDIIINADDLLYYNLLQQVDFQYNHFHSAFPIYQNR